MRMMGGAKQRRRLPRDDPLITQQQKITLRSDFFLLRRVPLTRVNFDVSTCCGQYWPSPAANALNRVVRYRLWVYTPEYRFMMSELTGKGTMQSGDFMRITAEFSHPSGSNPLINVWDYRCEASSDVNALQNIGEYIADGFIARYYTPLAAAIGSQIVMTAIHIRSYSASSEGYDEEGSLFTGGVNAPVLPAFVTYSLKLQRSEYDIRNGRKGYIGCTTQAVAGDGKPSAAVLDLFSTVGEGWAETTWMVEAGEADYAFSDVIVRQPTLENTNPTVWCYVASYAMTKFGTQNTRK